MELSPERHIYHQARLSRDARFDGRFFIGVRSTKIYCRPTCPVRTAREQNVSYFSTAAAAAEAGYRPCLRCRPESAPGTPAWSGTSSTVSRALRLISESAMEYEGVEHLAARLGIGSRQLRRLFIQHLGASPLAVIQTRRLHFAKKLINETNLPMGQIALAAGFGSVRRFNAAFQQTYNRTPTQLRRYGKTNPFQPQNEYLFKLHYRPPFAWTAFLKFIADRATPGVETIESGSYGRTISLNGDSGALWVSHDQNNAALHLRISFPEPRWLFLIVERIKRMFDLGADPLEIGSRLTADSLLSNWIESIPGLRVPGCWDGFELAVRAILGQQISVKAATTLAGRLVSVFGTRINASGPLTHIFPGANVLADADIARIGLPAGRAETIRALAKAVMRGQIAFESIGKFGEFREHMLEIPGIGEWTVQYVMMRALSDPDAFPANDLGLLHSLSIHRARDLVQRAERWRPWRAYAAMYLWQAEVSDVSHIDEVKRPSNTISKMTAA